MRARRDDGLLRFVLEELQERAARVGYDKHDLTLRQRFAARVAAPRRVVLRVVDVLYTLFRFVVPTFRDDLVLFQSIKFPVLIQETRTSWGVGVVVEGFWERWYCIKRFLPYLPVDDLSRYVHLALEGGSDEPLRLMVRRIVKRLRLFRPRFVVLWNDSLPVERAIVWACRELGIPTVSVQHGIYTIPPFVDGLASDYVLVWGPYFREMYRRHGLRTGDRIRILGYPYATEERESPPGSGTQKPLVYLLGQGLEAYRSGLLPQRMESILAVHRLCQELGARFRYRPHPAEERDRLRQMLPGVELSPQGEDLNEALQRGHVFVSFSSTALVEAGLRSKLTVQLRDLPLPTENLEAVGAVWKSVDDLAELERLLKDLLNAGHADDAKWTVSGDYVERPEGVGARFVGILNELRTETLGD